MKFYKKDKRLILITIFLSSLLFLYLIMFPDISGLKNENPEKTSFMEYRENEWKNENKNFKIKQKWVPYSKISPYLIKAVIIAEDDKFWLHNGFDFEAIQKAIEKNIKAKKLKMGASTISQQLVKNLYLSPSRNPIRKIYEAIITWKLERNLSKTRILELYLNVAEWGDKGIFGIESASRYYFGKHASDLTPIEASRLAAILPNPRRYNPLLENGYIARRANFIYRVMLRRRIIKPANSLLTLNRCG